MHWADDLGHCGPWYAKQHNNTKQRPGSIASSSVPSQQGQPHQYAHTHSRANHTRNQYQSPDRANHTSLGHMHQHTLHAQGTVGRQTKHHKCAVSLIGMVRFSSFGNLLRQLPPGCAHEPIHAKSNGLCSASAESRQATEPNWATCHMRKPLQEAKPCTTSAKLHCLTW